MNKLSCNISLLETIRCQDGKAFNISYHQKRFDKSRQELYHGVAPIDLNSLIVPPPEGLYRCRILYTHTIQSIEYIPYKPTDIHTLKIVNTSFDYHLKYANRDIFSTLLQKHHGVDDILIEKDGYITDTSIANIAFYDGRQWFTPKYPLLKGTMRQKLIDKGFLQTREIKKEALHHYTQVALTNAMLGFKILKDIHIIEK